jgi:hypothetical protein
LEAIVAGQGSLSGFADIFRDLQARTTVEALFGDALRNLDDMVKGGGKLEGSVDYLAFESIRAGDALLEMARVATDAADIMRSGADTGLAITRSDGAAARAAMTYGTISPNGQAESFGPDIVVEGTCRGIATSNSALALSPERYFELMTRRVAGPIAEQLDRSLGVDLFTKLEGAMSGVLYGLSSGGDGGAVLGGARGLIEDVGGKLFGGGEFGNMLAGTLHDGLTKALGGSRPGRWYPDSPTRSG